MKRPVGIVAVLLVSLGLAVPALAATLNVPSAFATIQAAEDAAAPFDRIIIAAGYYEENVVVDVDDLLIAGICSDPRRVIVDGGGGGDPVFEVDAARVTIKCLTAQFGDEGVYGDPAPDLTLERLRILESGSDGIYANNCDGIRVQLVEIIGAGDNGMELDCDDALIANNVVRRTNEGCYELTTEDSQIQYNEAFNCEDDEGFYIDGDRNLIRFNTVMHTEYPGLDVDGDENRILDNTITNAAYSDDSVSIDGDDNVIERNTISDCYYDCLGVSGDDNVIRWNTMTNVFDDVCADVDGDDLVFSFNTCIGGEYGFELETVDRAHIEGNRVERVGFDAFLIEGDGVVVKDNTARITGDDVFDITCNADCRDGEISGNLAEEAADDSSCFYVDIQDPAGMLITHNDGLNCSQNGLQLECDSCDVTFNEMRWNGNEDEAGFRIEGDDNLVRYNMSRDNAGPGYEIEGDDNRLETNTARLNLRSGILIDDVEHERNVLERNIVQNNLAEGINNHGSDTDLIRNRSQNNRPGGDCTNDGTIDDDVANVCLDGSDFAVGAEIDD